LWGRKVSDLGFGDFLVKAEWVANKLGKGFVKIDRWEPTSQTMSCCGHRQPVGLAERVVSCQGCGTVHDRDFNAAINILEAGRGLRAGVDP
jgi:putative transposase